MNTESIETVIIGAGQAGLSTGYHLRKLGREFVILDGNARLGDNWRAQWDSLRLYTPRKYDGLPGLPFPGDRWSYPGKDEVADYLESYAARFDLPVRTSTRVDRLEAAEDGYAVTIGDHRILARNVVVATGTFGRTPYLPEYAVDLDPAIRQLHSSEYRRPGQLKDGPVLVVGGSHSGTDIAYEVALTHPTVLCGRDPGQIPVRLEKKGARVFFPVFLFVGKYLLTRRTPMGRKEMQEIRYHGGPMLRVKRADLLGRGVERVHHRVTGVSNGRPVLDDGRVLDVANVVWSTGFRQVFDWIDLPVFGPDGWPEEVRGVAAGAPGLFFCGLCFQFAFASMTLPGVGRDAHYVAERIVARSGAIRSAAAA
ncbi:putative flavoprotein involved in K+ transport [Kribbella voronezhensis]|uniref:Putative flavoprotein involved in K+ transport n=1 Tax=Kribbella voronezhensis TaxID=2512212 RepID=A0A4R7T6T9_9ACTN|nr:NAD(P)/FAD-dependent oxidoreductase [Kribbella voronezhensis]TDU87309.1 putative flavoprotein involved in K+ transport [Kribbella voronezhensis]